MRGKLTNRLKPMDKNEKKNKKQNMVYFYFLFLVLLQEENKESKTWTRFLDLLDLLT